MQVGLVVTVAALVGLGAWGYRMARGRTPLVTIAPGAVYTWSRRSRPILLHGSTKDLSFGSCGFYANPPRMPS